MKHLKLFENQIKRYWMLQDPGTSYYDDATYLFDNEEDLFKFTMNKVYNVLKNNFDGNETDRSLEEHLSELDECDNAEQLIEFLNDAIDDRILGDYETRFRLETTSLDENIHLESWIEERRTAKKYNL